MTPARLSLAGMLAATGLLCLGCLKLEMATEIREDGSGRVAIRTEVDLAALVEADPNLAGQEVSLAALCTEMYDEDSFFSLIFVEYPWPLRPASYDRAVTASDDECSSVETITWDAEHSTEMLEQPLDIIGFEGPLIQRTDDGGWSFTLELDTPDLEGADIENFRAALDEFELGLPILRVSTALPGGPVEHNAISRSGGSFVWEYPFDSLPQEPLFAVTSPNVAASDDSPLAGGTLVAVSAAIVGAVLFVVGIAMRRARGAQGDGLVAEDQRELPSGQ